MSRAVRVEYPGATYHVMNRGVVRTATFLDDDERKDFLQRVGGLVEDGKLVVHAFCLMPNHYHLLCSTPRGGLSRWMRQINGPYAMAFNHRHRRVGPLWQGRYKAILVQDGIYMLECSRYIHLNPNRAKLTRPAEGYPWSSYRNYVGGPTAVNWVRRQESLRHFNGDREQYRRFVEAGKGEKEVSPFERAVAGLVLGGEGFVKGILKRLKDRPQSADQPMLGKARRMGRAPAEEVERTLAPFLEGVAAPRQRRLRMYALRLHSRLLGVQIARRCCCHPSTVSMAVLQLGQEAARRPATARLLARITQRLHTLNRT